MLLQNVTAESITKMHTLLPNIVNGITSLGKEFLLIEIVRKVLQTLPNKWKPKMMAIEEAKDIKTLSLEDLSGSQLILEMVLEDGEEEKPKKIEAFQVEEKKENEKPHEENDEEFTLLTRKFKTFLKNRCNAKKEESREEGSGQYFNFNKFGHLARIRRLLPLLSNAFKIGIGAVLS